jgi:putative intracellular protease/amidase
MDIAVLTFEGFNELDSFVVAALLNRAGQKPLEFAAEADAVVIGSGPGTRRVVKEAQILERIRLDPSRQMIASQCSGVLILHALGLVSAGQAVCTDLSNAERVAELGMTMSDQPFVARGNVATAGGCLSSQYIAAWIVERAAGAKAARDMIWYAAPVGEKDVYADRALAAAGIGETVYPRLSLFAATRSRSAFSLMKPAASRWS